MHKVRVLLFLEPYRSRALCDVYCLSASGEIVLSREADPASQEKSQSKRRRAYFIHHTMTFPLVNEEDFFSALTSP